MSEDHNFRATIVNWGRLALSLYELSDDAVNLVCTKYANAKNYFLAREEMYSIFVYCLKKEDQDDYEYSTRLLQSAPINEEQKRIKARRNVIRGILSRLFCQLGNLSFGPAFLAVQEKPSPSKSAPPVVCNVLTAFFNVLILFNFAV